MSSWRSGAAGSATLRNGHAGRGLFGFAGFGDDLAGVLGVSGRASGRLANVLLLIVFWVLLTYLLLPRLHRILTRLYVPGYSLACPNHDGLLGDPVNLARGGHEGRFMPPDASRLDSGRRPEPTSVCGS